MVYCSHCDDESPYVRDDDSGMTCCVMCGKVLDQDQFTQEPTFVKDGSGQSRLAGTICASIESGSSLSRERTEGKARDEIWQIVNGLHVGGGESIINIALNFYKLALDNNFTRGRRTTHVAAACLYIACRRGEKPYLLIDFSDYLKISVYVLGAVFLQLCQVLLLSDHPILQNLVDPSLFIHRFTERYLADWQDGPPLGIALIAVLRDSSPSTLGIKTSVRGLLGKKDNSVSDTALRIVASMKRDWMQTGRKPSGLCGAALYIAALSHGYDYTKSDIVAVVHVCEATLIKRLVEFENTDSGSLTIEDFLAKADEEPISKCSPKSGEVLCEHKDRGVEHFCHGLCEECFNNFTELSGGLEGGADPPAFQRAEKQRLEAAKKAKESAAVEAPDTSGDKSWTIASGEIANDSVAWEDPELGGENGKADTGSDSFSDIDDVEVDGYLHNEEETQNKKIIWEEMNKEYLEEQAAKQALAAELAARGVDVVEGQRKKRRSNADTKNSTPAETPAEATYNMLKRKGLGSKINVQAVGGLYNYNPEDVDGKANGGHMDFDGEFAHDIGDGETFDGGYDYAGNYNNDGYFDDGGGGAYCEYDDY